MPVSLLPVTKPSTTDEQAFLDELDKTLWNAAVYKHAVLGLIFLKYVSDAFDLRADYVMADPPFNISEWPQQLKNEEGES